MNPIEARGQRCERQPATAGAPAVDPATWHPGELARARDWIFDLSPAEVDEIDAAIAEVESRGIDIMAIGPDDFPLPTLDAKLAALEGQLMDGRGVALLRGLPVARLGPRRTAIACWGIAPGQRPSRIVVESTKLCTPLTPV